jgi:hypothetical protein
MKQLSFLECFRVFCFAFQIRDSELISDIRDRNLSERFFFFLTLGGGGGENKESDQEISH